MPIPGVASPTAHRCRRRCATPTTACAWRVMRSPRRLPVPGAGDKMAREAAMARGQRSVLREGIVAGVIGAAVVAVWFLAFDIARGKPFFTPGLLGAFVFQGVTSPVGVEPALGPIVGYTILHGLAFIAFGVIAASIMAASEQEPNLFIAFVILFACFEAAFFALIGAVSQSMLG